MHKLWALGALGGALVLGACMGTIGGEGTSDGSEVPSGSTGANFLRPLTKDEWARAASDALELELPASVTEGLPASKSSGDDVFSVADNLVTVNFSQFEGWRGAAEAVASLVVARPELLKKWMNNAPLSDMAGVRALVSKVGRRLYRAPLSEEEVTRVIAIAATPRPLSGQSEDLARIESILSALLRSPKFVYRLEPERSQGQSSPYEIAARLAWVLWGSNPDDALLDAAARGELSVSNLAPHVDRMLEDPRANKRLADFFRTLFDLQGIAKMNPNARDGVAAYYNGAVADMVKDLNALIEEDVVKGKGGIRGALTSKRAYVTKRLAGTYGVASTAPMPEAWKTDTGAAWVDLPPTRPGVLSRAGWLTYNGSGMNRTPAVYRGAVIQRRLLCNPTQANVVVPAPIPATDGLSEREQLDAKTKGCGASCHLAPGLINATGFALGRFDGYGQFRESVDGKPIDTSGSLQAVGGAFQNETDFVAQMVAGDALHTCFAKQFESAMTYTPATALPAESTLALAASSKGGASPQALVRAILLSPNYWSR